MEDLESLFEEEGAGIQAGEEPAKVLERRLEEAAVRNAELLQLDDELEFIKTEWKKLRRLESLLLEALALADGTHILRERGKVKEALRAALEGLQKTRTRVMEEAKSMVIQAMTLKFLENAEDGGEPQR